MHGVFIINNVLLYKTYQGTQNSDQEQATNLKINDSLTFKGVKTIHIYFLFGEEVGIMANMLHCFCIAS